jgi:peptide/nickel transport system permease protein
VIDHVNSTRPQSKATGAIVSRIQRWRSASHVTDVLVRILRSPGGAIGVSVLTLLLLAAIFAPHLTPYDPLALAPADALRPPSFQHPAGTDRFGRDILTRILYGTRISLQVGLISVGIAALFGGILGLLAGYFGGWVDTLIVFIINILLALPGILLALVIVAALGSGLHNVMIAVGISTIPSYARVVRGSTLSTRYRVYVDSAKAIGCSHQRILFRHILPNIVAPLIVLSTLGVATAVLIGASVSFLGLGAKPPTPEWGVMVNDGRSFLRQAWWLSTMPGLAIMVTVIALNLLGDALRDALDPRLKL